MRRRHEEIAGAVVADAARGAPLIDSMRLLPGSLRRAAFRRSLGSLEKVVDSGIQRLAVMLAMVWRLGV